MKARTLAAFALGILLTNRVWCFKPKTHVWIAQQVLNDVIPDGKVSIPPFGEISVPADVAAALREHQLEYRLGNIGPDAFPDVIAGQVTMHPGSGWPASKWLTFMVEQARACGDPGILSFAYGYAGHAAGDIFGHTYINLYAGDIFVLNDEQAVEVRHFALEDFIAKRTPPLAGPDGTPIPYEQLSVDARKIRDILFYSAVDQYRGDVTTAHLVGMYEFRRAVDSAASAAAGIEQNLGLNYLAPQLAALQAQLDIVSVAKEKWDQLQAERLRLQRRVEQIRGAIAEAQNRLNDLTGQLESLTSNAGRLVCLGGCEACVGKVDLPGGGSLGCDKGQCQRGCNEAFDRVQNLINQVTGLKNALNTELANAEQRILQLANEIDQAKTDYESKLAGEALKQAQATVDILRRLTADARILSGLLSLWRDDIDRATEAYITMSTNTAIELVREHGRPLAPFREWMTCWAPVFVGVPTVVSQAGCAAVKFVADLKARYDDFLRSLGSARYILDPVGAISADIEREYKDRVIQAITNEVAKDLMSGFSALGRGDLAHVVGLIFEMEGSAQSLNNYFSVDESGKGLLKIPDVAERASADMALSAGGLFDAEKFRPAYNSVILAKLALLDAAGFGELLAKAGEPAVPVPNITSADLLLAFVSSIDGNHQWQPRAPSYFRSDGWYPKNPEDLKKYSATVQGMALWASLRDAVFLKVFRGPLAPNLESPCVQNFADIVDRRYPYRACAQNPFPDASRTDNADLCRPRLEIESFSFTVEKPHLIVAQVEYANKGGGAATGSYEIALCPANNCKNRRSLARGAIRRPICSGMADVSTDTLTLPYLAPGNYRLQVTLRQAATKDPISTEKLITVPACSSIYRVKKGDNLIRIGEIFKKDFWDIGARNRIFDLNEIQAGKRICIPSDAKLVVANYPAPPALPPNDVAGPAGDFFSRGLGAYTQNRMKDAEMLLSQAVEAKPDFALAHFWLGMVSFNLNKKLPASEHLQRYLSLDPNGPEAATARELLELVK